MIVGSSKERFAAVRAFLSGTIPENPFWSPIWWRQVLTKVETKKGNILLTADEVNIAKEILQKSGKSVSQMGDDELMKLVRESDKSKRKPNIFQAASEGVEQIPASDS